MRKNNNYLLDLQHNLYIASQKQKKIFSFSKINQIKNNISIEINRRIKMGPLHYKFIISMIKRTLNYLNVKSTDQRSKTLI